MFLGPKYLYIMKAYGAYNKNEKIFQTYLVPDMTVDFFTLKKYRS